MRIFRKFKIRTRHSLHPWDPDALRKDIRSIIDKQSIRAANGKKDAQRTMRQEVTTYVEAAFKQDIKMKGEQVQIPQTVAWLNGPEFLEIVLNNDKALNSPEEFKRFQYYANQFKDIAINILKKHLPTVLLFGAGTLLICSQPATWDKLKI